MKKIILFFILGSCFTANAQNGFYLAPSLGFGKASADSKFIPPGNSSVQAYYLQAGIGYQTKKWQIESGLRYATSGYQYFNPEYIPYIYDPNIVVPEINYTIRYDHLVLPLTIGYQLKLTKRFSIVPAIGVMGSYNLSSSTTTEIPEFNTKKETLYAQEFTQRYERYSLWYLARIDAGYKLTSRLNIVAGIQSDRMINTFTTAYRYNLIRDQRNNVFLCSLGVQWHLKADNNMVKDKIQ